MAAPGFGFSVGDLIAAIQLVNRAANALQKSTGSAARYQQTVVQLNGLDAALRHAQALESEHGHTPITQHIKLCAHACHLPLARFSSKITKYEQFFNPAPCPTAPRFQKHLRKLQWAVSVEEELSKLQTSLLPQLSTINLFLQLQRSEDASQYQKSVLDAVQQVQAQIKSISNGQQSRRDSFVRKDSVIETVNQVSDPATHIDAVEDVLQQFLASRKIFLQGSAELETFLRSLSGTSLPLPRSHDRAVPTLTSSDHLYSSHSQHQSEYEAAAGSETEASLARQRQTPNLHYEANSFLAELLWFLCCLLSQARLFLRSITAVPKGPSMLLQDNIQLEDALGRVLSLPYEHFRYWPVIFARLQCEFKGLPGEMKVKQNQFLLVNMQMDGNRVLTSKKWETAVFPGARLAMSMLFKGSQSTRDCPRCSTPLSNRAAWLKCTSCGVVYRMLDLQRRKMQRLTSPASLPPDDDIMDAVDYVGYDEDVVFYQEEAEEIHSFRRIHLLRDISVAQEEPAGGVSSTVMHLVSKPTTISASSTVGEADTVSTHPSSSVDRNPISAETAATRHKPPPGAKWTKIKRRLVSPEALRRKGYRFEERPAHVIVFEVLTRDTIQNLANFTHLLREGSEQLEQGVETDQAGADETTQKDSASTRMPEVDFRNNYSAISGRHSSSERGRGQPQYPRGIIAAPRLPNTIFAGPSSLSLSPHFSSVTADRNAMSYASFRGVGYLHRESFEELVPEYVHDYVCCNLRLATMPDILQHYEEVHLSKAGKIARRAPQDQEHPSGRAANASSSAHPMQQQQQQQVGTSRLVFKCPAVGCEKACKDQYDLKYHMQHNHDAGEEGEAIPLRGMWQAIQQS